MPVVFGGNRHTAVPVKEEMLDGIKQVTARCKTMSLWISGSMGRVAAWRRTVLANFVPHRSLESACEALVTAE